MGKKKKTNPQFELTFKTAYDYMLERQKIKRISTGTPIDELIGGGIEEDECIEFYGEYGSGKSQICFTLAVKVAAQGNDVVYIDTENTFKPERISEIAEANGYDPKEVLSRIHLIKPLNSDAQMEALKQIPKSIKPKLLIVDALTTLFREEYIGRGELSERQGLLRRHIRDLKDYARENKCAIIVTNQVYGNPDATPFMPLELREQAVGGHTLYHMIDNRIFIRKGPSGTRIAKLVDSSRYPPGERPFVISEKGGKRAQGRRIKVKCPLCGAEMEEYSLENTLWYKCPNCHLDACIHILKATRKDIQNFHCGDCMADSIEQCDCFDCSVFCYECNNLVPCNCSTVLEIIDINEEKEASEEE